MVYLRLRKRDLLQRDPRFTVLGNCLDMREGSSCLYAQEEEMRYLHENCSLQWFWLVEMSYSHKGASTCIANLNKQFSLIYLNFSFKSWRYCTDVLKNINTPLVGTIAVMEKFTFVCLEIFLVSREEGCASSSHCWPSLWPYKKLPLLASHKAKKTFPYSLLVVSTDWR